MTYYIQKITSVNNQIKTIHWLIVFILLIGNITFGQTSFVQTGNKIVGSNVSNGSYLGSSVSVSEFGNIIAIGGPGLSFYSGATWIYTSTGGNWANTGIKLVSTTDGYSLSYLGSQGTSVSLSNDGMNLLVGAPYDSSWNGSVSLFRFDGQNWNRTKVFKEGPNTSFYGSSVAISGDGSSAIIGSNGVSTSSGAAWIYTFTGANWVESSNKLMPVKTVANQLFGQSVDISSNGKVAIIGSPGDSSNLGCIWIYRLNSGSWLRDSQKLIGSDAIGNSKQGRCISISSDGNTILFNGIGGAYAFTFTGSTWTQMGNKLTGNGMINSNTFPTVKISGDGRTALVCGGTSNSFNNKKCWSYTLTGSNWNLFGDPLVPNDNQGDASFGSDIDLTYDGKLAFIGGATDNSYKGAFWIFELGTSTGVVANTIAYNVKKFEIYPNPFINQFSINANESIHYHIKTMSGSLMEEGDCENECQIGSKIGFGMYLLFIKGRNSDTVKKIIKIP